MSTGWSLTKQGFYVTVEQAERIWGSHGHSGSGENPSMGVWADHSISVFWLVIKSYTWLHHWRMSVHMYGHVLNNTIFTAVWKTLSKAVLVIEIYWSMWHYYLQCYILWKFDGTFLTSKFNIAWNCNVAATTLFWSVLHTCSYPTRTVSEAKCCARQTLLTCWDSVLYSFCLLF